MPGGRSGGRCHTAAAATAPHGPPAQPGGRQGRLARSAHAGRASRPVPRNTSKTLSTPPPCGTQGGCSSCSGEHRRARPHPVALGALEVVAVRLGLCCLGGQPLPHLLPLLLKPRLAANPVQAVQLWAAQQQMQQLRWHGTLQHARVPSTVASLSMSHTLLHPHLPRTRHAAGAKRPHAASRPRSEAATRGCHGRSSKGCCRRVGLGLVSISAAATAAPAATAPATPAPPATAPRRHEASLHTGMHGGVLCTAGNTG